MLRDAGVAVWIISGEDSDIVRRRCEKLRITDYWLGVDDKATLLNQLLQERHISQQHVAYIGDDVNDLEVMQMVGFSACPVDAQPAVRASASWQSQFPGGRGAVRELCEYMLGHIRSGEHVR